MAKFSSTAAFWGLLIGSSLITFGVKAQDATLAQASSRQAETEVANWFEANRDRPTLLRAFVQRMPKGGDIHTHLSGAVYAEHYIQWAAADGYCIDPAIPALVEPSACNQDSSYFPAAQLYGRPATYDALINLWSTRNLPFAGQSGHDQFFEAFGGFDAISSSLTRQDDMVAEVANRAAAQHIFYLELLMTVKGSEARQLGRTVGWSSDFAQMRQRLLDAGLMDLVAQGSQDMAALEREVGKTLGCETPRPQPGCAVTVRYLQQTTRTRLPEEVFAQFVYAFELAKADSRVVGINLVAPEDNPVALRDYSLHMEMLGFLKAQFPEVNVSLHAGELTLGLVPPDDLRFHIRQAVEVAQASRIGHGVAILYEDEPFQLLEEMRRRDVLVEICLTSNEVILNVEGDEHPFLDYRAVGVPMTLASDDEGIARIDLSNEYGLATQRYDLSYRDLKQLARNSLEYSFLEGDSLWASPEFGQLSASCAGDTPGLGTTSEGCASFLEGSDRARIQWQLEAEFAEFESLSSFRSR
ncbi:adenosine deaminase [Nodosilinea sp. FACHB-131]|uniref:adenosine deaminase family protein n=1 Tax=Cyanophyceae TaxID=3028117 RepID=UPI0016894056|nr:adenosine deaminase [Nodosilinea sp. FACHB-131]MBD1873304.1 adenosine deaminase [Nodosilinea sp. FACHB-131]